ncbi:MAG: hypothetical protein ABUL72_03065 [Armatimonadota bacterium]
MVKFNLSIIALICGSFTGLALTPVVMKCLPRDGEFGHEILAKSLRSQALSSGQLVNGSSSSKVLVVEFSDYLCDACRRSDPFLDSTLAEAPNISRVLVHFPFHDGARNGAIYALAGSKLGLGREIHLKMISSPPSSWKQLFEILCKDKSPEQVKAALADAEVMLVRSNDLTKSLSIQATPKILIVGENDVVFEATSWYSGLEYLQYKKYLNKDVTGILKVFK